MIKTGFGNLNHLLLMVVTDQLLNSMMEAGFQNLNHFLLIVTQNGLDFQSLIYIW